MSETPAVKPRHVLDQVINSSGDWEVRPDVKEFATELQKMRDGHTESMKKIMSLFAGVVGPRAVDLDANEQIAVFTPLAQLSDEIEKRTNEAITAVMANVRAYKKPPPGNATSVEIQATVVPAPKTTT